MTLHNDHKWQLHGADSCKDASVNERAKHMTDTDIRYFPTNYWEWQQSFRPDRPNSTRTLREEMLEHQLGLCVNAMLVILLSYLLFPDLTDRTSGFFMLSYPLDSSYGIGPQDLKLVLGFMTFFTAARVAVMDYMLKPLAVNIRVSKPSTLPRRPTGSRAF
jgi:hypothetical protein